MLRPSTSEPLTALRQQIEASVLAYLATGGEIDCQPIRTGAAPQINTHRIYQGDRGVPARPMTPKAQIRANANAANIAKLAKAKAKRAEFAPRLRELAAAGMSTEDIKRELGTYREQIQIAAKEHGIKLNKKVGGKPKLTVEQVRAIRADYAKGIRGKALAEPHGCSVTCASNAATGRTRSDVK